MAIHNINWQMENRTGDSPYLHIWSEAPLRTFHSSIWNGGYGYHRHLINRQVPKLYSSDDPAAETEQFLVRQGLASADCCALLTAAYVAEAGYIELSHMWEEERDGVEILHNLTVQTWVTAGLGNAARAGMEVPVNQLYPGTINIIIVIHGEVTDTALAGAFITATEAKAAVLQDQGIRVPGTDRLATGTTTDAILVAATGAGSRTYQYTGTATVLGNLIGRSVYEATTLAVERYIEAVK